MGGSYVHTFTLKFVANGIQLVLRELAEEDLKSREKEEYSNKYMKEAT